MSHSFSVLGIPISFKKSRLGPFRPHGLVHIDTDEPPSFYMDDGSAPERAHHWEIKTKQKIVSSRRVQQALKDINQSPESFYEMEILLRDPKASAVGGLRKLDEAVHSALIANRFSETYLGKLKKAMGPAPAEAAHREAIARARNGEMSDEELVAQIWHAEQMLRQMKNDADHRQAEYSDYKRRAVRDGFKTFGYLGDLQGHLRTMSQEAEGALALSLEVLKQALAERRRA